MSGEPEPVRKPGIRSGRLALRLFVADIDQPRSRRAGDLARLLIAFLGLASISLVALPPSGLEAALKEIIAAFPHVLDGLWRVSTDLLGLFAMFLIGASLWRRRLALLRDMAVATLLAIGVAALISFLVAGEVSINWARPAAETGAWSPWLRVIWPVTVISVTAPHVVRPFRVVGMWAIGVGLSGAILGQMVGPSLGAASLLIALMAASATALLFGSPRGRPDVSTVEAALLELGVSVSGLSPATRESQGVFVLDATGSDGTPLIVKVYGRDAYDTQLVSTAWRRVWFRNAGSPVSAGRLGQVGNEAYLTLLVEQKGIPTHSVVTAGMASNGDAILVLAARGEVLGDADWSKDRLSGLFLLLDELHVSRIAHGQVDVDHVVLVDGRVGLADYRGARVTSDPWRLNVDLAQAFVAGATRLGPEAAVAVAVEALGAARVGEMLPYLQPDILTGVHRRGLKEAEIDVDDLREGLAATVGIEAPELVQLRRVTVGSILRAVLPLLAFFALASVFAGLDVDQLFDTLSNASWWFVLVGILISQLPRLSQTMSAMGATPIPIPAGRLYMLQLAQSYIALSIPGGAARIALNTRFFQRHGLATGTALAVGALDGFTGFLSQVILLALIFTLTSATLDLDLGNATSSGLVTLLLWMIGLGIVTALVFLIVPRLRRWIFGYVKDLWEQAKGALEGLFTIRRLALLFGGGLLTETLFAVSLGAFAIALGFPVGLPELILVVVVVGLAAGILPVPGGIGVVEAGIIFGLARAGVPEEAAFAIAILYRFATYYLPPAWGLFAFRHLERNKHL